MERIEVVSRSTPLSKAPYELNQKELKELKKQLNYLQRPPNQGYIQQKKLPYGAHILVINIKKTS